MHLMRSTLVLGVIALCAAFGLGACEDYDGSTRVDTPAPPGADAKLSGTITYRERIALTPDAVVTVQLRDTSYADAASVLIAEQIIAGAGQVPIEFELRYAGDEIDNRNTYSISAVITEGDGRMAFTNDTAYDVITRGNPRHVDISLVMVEPPPELVPEGWSRSAPNRVEAPVHVTDVEIIWDYSSSGNNQASAFVQVAFAASSVDGCYRIGQEEATRDGFRYDVIVTAWVPAPTGWEQDCSNRDLALDAVVHLGDTFVSGESFDVAVNNEHHFTFVVP